MSSAFLPEPPEPDPADTAASADQSYVSEFLSENSPEFSAARQAALNKPVRAAAPRITPATVAAPVAETRVAAPAPTIVRTERRFPRWLMVTAGVAALVAAAGAWYVQQRQTSGATGTASAPAVAVGTATIMSRPEGAEVFIGGESRGLTPLRLSLPVGDHTVELRNGAATRSLTLTIDAATAVRETVDLEPSAALGRLEVRTDLAGARVSVNGTARGVTPLVLSDLTPGAYQIVISRGDVTLYRTATVAAGTTAAIVASVAPAGATGGWLTFQSPIEMQVRENGEVLGTTRTGRLMVPAGRHELQLAADAFEFTTTATAVVTAGGTVTIPVAVPNGRLSINAVPWADVWLDGQPLGSTPLANLSVPIGDHDVVWRHPDLGERRQSVRVSAVTPARAGVDLNR